MRSHPSLLLLAAALLASSSAFAQFRGDENLSSNEIREVQRALRDAGHLPGAIDGVWGESTERSLRTFQQSKGLDPSGTLDERTILALGFSANEFAEGGYVHPQLSAAEVRDVQQALNRAGYEAGPVDGDWGASDENALRQFQEARGLRPTGRLDQRTVLALGFSIADFAAGEFREEEPPSR